jgi:hypothetical protein
MAKRSGLDLWGTEPWFHGKLLGLGGGFLAVHT